MEPLWNPKADPVTITQGVRDMPKINLTDAFVSSVVVDTRTEFWDAAKHSAIVLRVSPVGVKSWSVVYRRPRDGRKARVTLGTHPGLSLSRARERSREVLAALSEGSDPAQEKSDIREGITVAELIPQ